MYGKVILALAIAAAVLLLCRLLRGALLTPVRPGKALELAVHLRATGPAPELESVVKGLLWLAQEGILPARLVIEDGGMDAETRRAAELLTKDNGWVSLWTREKNNNN